MELKGQNHFGNKTGHILLNLSVILGSKKKVMTWIQVSLVILVIVGSDLISKLNALENQELLQYIKSFSN